MVRRITDGLDHVLNHPAHYPLTHVSMVRNYGWAGLRRPERTLIAEVSLPEMLLQGLLPPLHQAKRTPVINLVPERTQWPRTHCLSSVNVPRLTAVLLNRILKSNAILLDYLNWAAAF